jgi:hypothetical protein
MVLVMAALSCSFYVACGDDDVVFGAAGSSGSGGSGGGGGSGGASGGAGGGGGSETGGTAGTGEGGEGGSVDIPPDGGVDAGDSGPSSSN